MLQDFFQIVASDVFRRDLIKKFDVKYIFYSISDRQPNAYNPQASTFLKERFRNNLAVIYEVMPQR
jgi:hypothetical protein